MLVVSGKSKSDFIIKCCVTSGTFFFLDGQKEKVPIYTFILLDRKWCRGKQHREKLSPLTQTKNTFE